MLDREKAVADLKAEIDVLGTRVKEMNAQRIEAEQNAEKLRSDVDELLKDIGGLLQSIHMIETHGNTRARVKPKPDDWSPVNTYTAFVDSATYPLDIEVEVEIDVDIEIEEVGDDTITNTPISR